MNVGLAAWALLTVQVSPRLQEIMQLRSWGPLAEGGLGWAVTLGFLTASYVMAVWLSRYLLQHRARAAKTGVVVLMTGVTALALSALVLDLERPKAQEPSTEVQEMARD